MKRPEQSLQIQCAKILDRILLPHVLWTAIGHGGGGALRGAILKGMGVKPGVPDAVIFWKDGPEGAQVLWLEFKAPKGTWSVEQKRWSVNALNCGHYYAIIKSVDELIAALQQYAVPIRRLTAS